MAEQRVLNAATMLDLINGACILGSGGGGPLSVGYELKQVLDKIGYPAIVPPGAVPGQARMAVTAIAGSPDAATGQKEFPYDVATRAFTALEGIWQKPFDYVLPVEIGAANSLVPLVVGAMKKIPVIDADGAGRAIPSLPLCTFAANKLPISPLVLADDQQQVSFSVADAAAAEGPMRAIITSEFPGFAGVAFWSMSGSDMQKTAIKTTMTVAMGLGEALRLAVQQGQDPVAAVCSYTGGREIFRGRNLTAHETTAGGFDWGTVSLESVSDPGEHLYIYNQNENMIAWSSRRAQPLAMAPDLICYLTTEGQPFSNADLDLAKDKVVSIIAIAANPALCDPVLVAAFQTVLRQLGYAGPYVPL